MASLPPSLHHALAHAHGQFAAKAKAAGMSTEAFAEKHKGDPGVLGHEARLALTLMHFNHGKSPEHHDSMFPKSAG